MNQTLVGQYKFVREIGDGSFGTVYLAEDSVSAVKVAIKELKLSKSQLSRKMPNFKREVKMMQKLRHPNVVQFLDKFESGERVYIVTEFCSLGELTQHAENGSLKPEQILEMSWQLINGLEYIHQEGYIHRDLKPDNIFIAEGFIAKIGDCGLGKKYEEGVRNTRNVGTPLYTPPNILVGDDQYTQKCDVYSLGLIIYFLVFGEHLFGGARSIFDLKEKQETMLKQLDKLTKGLNCEERFKKIFRSTLAYEEQQRITSTQLKQLFQREFFSESKLKSPALLQLDQMQRLFGGIQDRFKSIQKYLQLARLLVSSKGSVLGLPQSYITAVLSINIYALELFKSIVQCERPIVVDAQALNWGDSKQGKPVKNAFLQVLRGQFKSIEALRKALVKRTFKAAGRESIEISIKILRVMEQPYLDVLKESKSKYETLLIQYLGQQKTHEHIAMTPQEQMICDFIDTVLS